MATDHSREAELAARSAEDLAKSTASELHVAIIFQETAYVHSYYEVRLPKVAEQLREQAREEIQKALAKK